MASKTDIANLALGRVGANKIMDIDDPNVKGAREVRNVFESSVRELSRLNKWTALTARKELGQLTSTPPFGWSYAYQLPVDYIRIIEFNRVDVWDRTKELFTIEEQTLLTNQEMAQIVYVKYQEDSTKYDDLFVKALSVNIGSKIAVPMRQDEALAQALMQEFEQIALPTARRIDSTEKKIRQWDPCEGSRFISARRYSTNG